MSSEWSDCAARLTTISNAAWRALDDDTTDRQHLLEITLTDLARLADAMRTQAHTDSCPLCQQTGQDSHPGIPRREGVPQP